jgi:hypothetical protein
MKSFFIALFTALLFAGPASAQNFNLGVKGGLNIYEIYNDNNVDYNTKPGLHLGLLGHIHLTDRFALQPELMYSGQGSQFMVGTVENKLNLHYLNVPLLIQFMFDNGFRLQAGPQLGFLVGANSRVNDVSTDIRNNYRTLDLGVGLGAGYVHPPTGFGVDARYNIGLGNINSGGTVNSTNRGIQVGLFYLFNHRN